MMPVLIIGGLIALIYFNPGILSSFNKNSNTTITTPSEGETMVEDGIIQPESVVPLHTYMGKPMKDSIEFSCKYDSDCIIYNDNCDNDCRCDTERGECYSSR